MRRTPGPMGSKRARQRSNCARKSSTESKSLSPKVLCFQKEIFEADKKMAGTTGLEPATSDVTVKEAGPSFRRSI